MKGPIFAVLAVLAITGVADAQQTVVNGQRFRSGLALVPVGGYYPADSTGRMAAMTDGGAILVANESPDRDHWMLANAGLQATDIAARTVFKSQLPVTLQDYSALTAMLSWAASDTDTVALEVACMCKQSTNPGDGLDYLIDMNPTTSSPVVDGISIMNAPGLAYSAMSSPRTYMVTKSGNMTSVTQGPLTAVNAVTTVNAIAIPLTEAIGSFLKCPIWEFWVFNKKSTQMDDVTLDIWAKVAH